MCRWLLPGWPTFSSRIGACSRQAARTVQGMARVRSGQAPAWPLVAARRGAEAPALKGGSRRSFLLSGYKGSSGALDGGGAPPGH